MYLLAPFQRLAGLMMNQKKTKTHTRAHASLLLQMRGVPLLSYLCKGRCTVGTPFTGDSTNMLPCIYFHIYKLPTRRQYCRTYQVLGETQWLALPSIEARSDERSMAYQRGHPLPTLCPPRRVLGRAPPPRTSYFNGSSVQSQN